MYGKLTELFIVAKIMLEDRAEQSRERGATALEYVGMVLVAAFVVGAVVTAIQGAGLAGKVTAAITKILTGPA